jgi:hypothetical protein
MHSAAPSHATNSGLRLLCCFFSSGPSTGSVLASTGAERLGLVTKEDPSIGLGTSIDSMRLGRCVKTLTFFDLGALEVAEVTFFLFFPCFHEG